MLKLGIVVGHEADRPGAVLNGCDMTEYQYNSQIARMMELMAPPFRIDLKVFFRDGIGIIRAHEAAEEWGANVVIELHFNSHADQSINGAEVLCKPEYVNAFTTKICASMAQLFMGHNRGVKNPATPFDDGHPNVYRPVPTYLLEPFFGSNVEQAKNALIMQKAYARQILVDVRDNFNAP